jgi:hypothetical protein
VTLSSTINLPLDLAGLNWLNPVSILPFLRQGFCKVLCVSVWFRPRKSNAMIDPTEALSEAGENFNSPAIPTVTVAVETATPCTLVGPDAVVVLSTHGKAGVSG